MQCVLWRRGIMVIFAVLRAPWADWENTMNPMRAMQTAAQVTQPQNVRAPSAGTRLGDTPRAPCALQWLTRQAPDIMDACLNHLDGKDHAALASAWVQAADAVAQPRTLMTSRLAAASHRHFDESIAPGPLCQAVVRGLGTMDATPYDATHWLRLPQWRDGLLRERDDEHREALTKKIYRPTDKVSRDNTAAIMALDRLDAASPCHDAIALRNGVAGSLFKRRQNARIAGFEALLLASSFSAAMQGTLVAHVIVGIALAYVGHKEQAIAVLKEAVDVRLPKAIKLERDDGAHPFFGVLRGHSTSPGQQAMLWMNSAALAADAPELQELVLRGSSYLEPLHQLPIWRGGLPRWSHLETQVPIDHELFQRWRADIGLCALSS